MKKLIASILGSVLAVPILLFGSPVGAQMASTTTTTTTTVTTTATTTPATVADLQARINQLLAIVTALKAQLGTTRFVFTGNLTVGSSGTEVTELQKFLVARGFLTMPTGVEFGYFGLVTQAALTRFQASQGVSPAVGYFGPVTRLLVNEIM